MRSSLNLFMVYVGGQTETSLIEVHDIQFAFGEKIEDTYSELRKKWWGTKESLHLDAWGMVKCVDGYNVVLKNEPAINCEQKLFFVNLGGYDPHDFTELHKNMLVVAEHEGDAKIKAKATVSDWKVPHKDNLYDVENCVSVSEILRQNGLFIHLEKTNKPETFEFICKYVPIAEKKQKLDAS